MYKKSQEKHLNRGKIIKVKYHGTSIFLDSRETERHKDRVFLQDVEELTFLINLTCVNFASLKWP